jgi:hypothetical protein
MKKKSSVEYLFAQYKRKLRRLYLSKAALSQNTKYLEVMPGSITEELIFGSMKKENM